MEKVFSLGFLCLMLIVLSACGTSNSESLATSTPEPAISETELASSAEQSEPTESSAPSSAVEVLDEEESTYRKISVQFGESEIIYELNDGTAADSFYEQLPLTIEVEDYSTNEKIFYPHQTLDTSNSPLAQAGTGTLAYYEPWGDIVFFYDDYNENPFLFELGQIISGGELISQMSGTVTIEIVE